MTGPDNITYLNQKNPDVLSRRVLVKRLLPRFKSIAEDHLKKILQNMFENADDALFKMSESAEKTDDTNMYLDSMRIVRLQRESIEQNFFDQMNKGFNDYLQENHQPQKQTNSTDIDYDSMELVAEDDLEITLAIERLIQKIHSLYQPDLSAINKRMAYLFNLDEIDAATIPFGPEFLVNAYASAAESIELELEIRIILLKLFDWQCITGLAALYQTINNEFIDADVLPVIKTSIRHHATPSHQSGVAVPAATPSAPTTAPLATGSMSMPTGGLPAGGLAGDGNVWGTLQNLLGQYRDNLPGGAIGNGGGGGYSPMHAGLVAGASLTPITGDEMMQSLTSLQQDIGGAIPEGGAHAVGNFVRVQLQTGDGDNQRQLRPLDNDLIDVVCLVFEYILDDPQLPDSAKASLARLQIPFLKVAMLDQDFFSMHGHPARNLLNHMAQAALGIDDNTDSENPILLKIHDITQLILDDFTDDISLFVELENEFSKFMDDLNQNEQTALSEIEMRQQEREELALARAWVRETLEQHLLGRALPGVIADIILGPWKDVMLQTYLQEGENSTLWKTQIRFIDVLCWSVEPKELKIDKSKLGNIIKQLIKTLKQGLQQIDYPQAEVDAIFSHLEPFHLASVRGQKHVITSSEESMNDISMRTSLNILDEEYKKMHAEQEHELSGEYDQVANYDDKVILEDITLEGWEQDPILDEIDDEYLQLARHLEMGKWVEFTNEKGKKQRAKLAWKSDLLGEYTFLNWKFDVVADKSLTELADALRHGSARVVEDVPLMDRALSAVLTTLTPKTASK